MKFHDIIQTIYKLIFRGGLFTDYQLYTTHKIRHIYISATRILMFFGNRKILLVYIHCCTKILATIFLVMLFFWFICCVREAKPGRVMACVCDFAESEAHWQNHKRMTSMAIAIFSYTAVYFCSFLFPPHFRHKTLIKYSVGD